MKTLAATFVLAAFLVSGFNSFAQARQLTRRIVNPDNTLKTPNAPAAPTPTPSAPPAVAPPASTAVVTNVVPEKTKEQKEEMIRKTIEFQKHRAIGGAPTAQYDLGMRYLNGDGVEKDPALAHKWLGAAATNGHSQAIKKFAELNKKEAGEK